MSERDRMSGIKIAPQELGLDALGRVVLSDDLLDGIEAGDRIVAGGGDPPSNYQCHDPTQPNDHCSNTACDNSANFACMNEWGCGAAANLGLCREPNEVPEQ
jgi:hypothetical protein